MKIKSTNPSNQNEPQANMPQGDTSTPHANVGAASNSEKLQRDLDKTKAELIELTGDLQRTRADFENYRKQVDLQKENERKSTRFATVYKLLPLLDDLDRAIITYASELTPLAKSLEKTLKELGLTKIPSAPGTDFNPDLHDAVMVEGDGDHEVIAETLRPGYYYEGEVLRPTMVKVKAE